MCFFVFWWHREGNLVLKLENGKDLSVENFEKSGFNRPILIANKDGLGMVVPDKNFTVMDVERCVGMYWGEQQTQTLCNCTSTLFFDPLTVCRYREPNLNFFSLDHLKLFNVFCSLGSMRELDVIDVCRQVSKIVVVNF